MRRLLHGRVPCETQRLGNTRQKKRAVRTVIVVVVTFAVCWLPIQLVLLVQSAIRDFEPSTFTFAISVAANCLAYMNSCLNLILYVFLSKDFRQSFINLLCCSRRLSSKFEHRRENVQKCENVMAEQIPMNRSKERDNTKGNDDNLTTMVQIKSTNKHQKEDLDEEKL